jgi:hypothetical protein
LTNNEIGQISSAIHKFYYSRMKYPVNLGELVNEGFINDSMIKDPWGNRYNYILTDSYYMIICSTNLDDGQEPIQLKVRIYI